jgi:RNA polymerase sigma-70 factor (ECF subfamily)
MAIRDQPAGCDSPLPLRDAELTARFVNGTLPHLDQLQDSARQMTRNAVDAEDLLQETVLRAYAGFNSFAEVANIRAWLFRIMMSTYVNGRRRARHRASEYLSGQISDRHLVAEYRQSPSRNLLTFRPELARIIPLAHGLPLGPSAEHVTESLIDRTVLCFVTQTWSSSRD